MTSPLIAGYVAGLRRKLPGVIADEAAEGLTRPTSITAPPVPATTGPPVLRWRSSGTPRWSTSSRARHRAAAFIPFALASTREQVGGSILGSC